MPVPLRLTIKDRGPLARYDPLYCLFDTLRGVRAGGGGMVEIDGKGRSIRMEVVDEIIQRYTALADFSRTVVMAR